MDKDYNPKIFDWSGDWLHILYFTKMHDIIAARICTISKYEANYLYARNRYKTRGMSSTDKGLGMRTLILLRIATEL
jgi:hypothetical protein